MDKYCFLCTQTDTIKWPRRDDLDSWPCVNTVYCSQLHIRISLGLVISFHNKCSFCVCLWLTEPLGFIKMEIQPKKSLSLFSDQKQWIEDQWPCLKQWPCWSAWSPVRSWFGRRSSTISMSPSGCTRSPPFPRCSSKLSQESQMIKSKRRIVFSTEAGTIVSCVPHIGGVPVL